MRFLLRKMADWFACAPKNASLMCGTGKEFSHTGLNCSLTLRKLVFHFLSNLLGYDHGDSFPFDFEPNGNPFGSKSKGKLSPRPYPIHCERKWKYSFLSVASHAR